jgi:hypothetical protein
MKIPERPDLKIGSIIDVFQYNLEDFIYLLSVHLFVTSIVECLSELLKCRGLFMDVNMDVNYVEPSYKLDEFNCPYCSTLLRQTWYRVMHDSGDDVHRLPSYEMDSDSLADSRLGVVLLAMENSCEPEAHIASRSEYVRFVKNVAFSKCNHCGKYAVWVRDRLVYPANDPEFED